MASLLNMSGSSLLNKGLPYDAEIEYLRFVVDQCYIELPINCSSQLVMEMHGVLDDGSRGVPVLWNRYSTSNPQYSYSVILNIDYTSAGEYRTVRVDYGSGANNVYQNYFGQNYLSGNFHLIFGKGEFTIDNQKTVLKNHSQTFVSPTEYFIIGSRTLTNNVSWKLNGCSITDNDVLVFDFIPVRVGQVGYMYDKVSGQLFGNAGTGDFILGPDKTN